VKRRDFITLIGGGSMAAHGASATASEAADHRFLVPEYTLSRERSGRSFSTAAAQARLD